MILIDTNIFLELLLDQDRAKEVETFFQDIGLRDVFISDFSLHSIGVILNHLKMENVYVEFVNDVIINGEVKIITLQPNELCDIEEVVGKYKLDFDDSYQYLVAKYNQLQLVSYDTDFDKTNIGRKLPSNVFD